MQTIKFDLSKKAGKFRPLNAVNGGPHHLPPRRTNLELFKEMRVPYCRVHDTVFWESWGGCHSVDISAIFPDFNKNPYDPYSYDFSSTDRFFSWIIASGAKPYYRLGQTIESFPRKYGAVPPADFKKWAVICVHIIMHYNKGWANGFNYDIEYWEIWNEPDLENDFTWTGTDDQFFDFFEIAAKHLKKRFPEYKIGGPGIVSSIPEWYNTFLSEMQQRQVPIDFFSWHRYPNVPEKTVARSKEIRQALIKYGYRNAESHVTEWNYMPSIWDEHEITSTRELAFNYATNFRLTHKGAAHALAVMSACQDTDIDVLMYYDTRPGLLWNAIFEGETFKKRKAFYAFEWFGKFYDAEAQIKAENNVEKVYTLCGIKPDGKILATATYFTEVEEEYDTQKEVKLDFGKKAKFNVYLVDEDHDGELILTTEDTTLTIKANQCYLLEEI